MAIALVTNNAFSVLASGINSSAVSLTVTATEGALFPNPTGSDYFYVTLIDTSNNLEIVKCTARSTDVLTIVRGQEGTSNIAFSAADRIELRLTAAGLESSKIADDAIDSEHYTDGSIDTAHLGNLQVTAAKIAADAIDGTKLADNAVDSEHYTDGSIDNAHIADDAIDSEHYAAGSIDSAHLADDAVTLAKMASGVDGVIISYDASGNPAHIGPGSDGEVLTSTGAGSPPAFEAAAAGGAGYFLGNSSGATGDTTSGLEDIFRVNSATVDNSCTIAANTNASCTGPLTVSSGVVIIVSGVLAVI